MKNKLSISQDEFDKIKKVSVKEFREKGYLQELNRQFLHPLGLALSVYIDENEEEIFGGIWDYREDPEGIYYDLENSDEKRKKSFTKKSEFIEKERQKFAKQTEEIRIYH